MSVCDCIHMKTYFAHVFFIKPFVEMVTKELIVSVGFKVIVGI